MTPLDLRADHLFIGGHWVTPTSPEVLEVRSPADGRVVGRVPHAGVADVERAVAAARDAFDRGPWPRMTVAERIEIVTRIRDAIIERGDELAQLITAQNGSPITFSRGGQVTAAVAVWSTSLATAAAFVWEEERVGMGGPIRVRHEPVGVVAAVTPWNVPQFAIAAKLAPALLAGCTVVLKPSPEAPLDAQVFAEICDQAGLPAGVVNVVPAGRETGAHLVGHRDVDKVAFTGSAAAGRSVMASAAANLTRVTLELGGKSAGVILPDADLDVAVPALVRGAFLNSGQACVALTRLLVPRSRRDEVLPRLQAAVEAMVVGDPMDPRTMIGPLITPAHQERVVAMIESAWTEGARVLTGGGVPEGQGNYVTPTLLVGVESHMRVAREEIFGPVVCILEYDDVDDALQVANDSDFGLSGAVFAGTEEAAAAFARRIRTGTVAVNCQRVDFLAPFGGYRNSGIGREFGAEGLRAFTEVKSLIFPNEG